MAAESAFLEKPWQEVRSDMRVKLLESEGEHYVLARSAAREQKERSMRLRRLKRLRDELVTIAGQIERGTITRDKLLMKLGAAKKAAGRAYGLFVIDVPEPDASLTGFAWRIDRAKWQKASRREGRYLLRTNQLPGKDGHDAAELWRQYIRLVRIEESFRNLKGDLGIRPVYHQLESRIEAHIFISFIAYCMHVTLEMRMKPKAPRTESAQPHLTAQRHPDARGSNPDHRWAQPADAAVYQARQTPSPLPRPTWLDPAFSTATGDLLR